MRSPEEGAAKAVLEIISTLSASMANQTVSPCLLGFMQLVSNDFPKSQYVVTILRLTRDAKCCDSFPDTIISSMSQLHDQVLSVISPKITVFVESEQIQHLPAQTHLLSVWCAVLSFGRWLSKGSTLPQIGRHMASKIVPALRSASSSQDSQEQLARGAFAVLLEEHCHCHEGDRPSHLELSVATYISLYALVASSGM